MVNDYKGLNKEIEEMFKEYMDVKKKVKSMIRKEKNPHTKKRLMELKSLLKTVSYDISNVSDLALSISLEELK